MDAIKSYLSIIQPPLLQHITGKPGEFIRQFQQEKYLTEEAFIQTICKGKHDATYYRELKSRTLKLLQAMAIVSAPKGGNIVAKKIKNCRKYFLTGQIFLDKGERKEGLRLIKLAHQIAVEYNFVYYACELSSILYHNHVYYQRSKKKANGYAAQVDYYLQEYTAEKKAEHHFYQALLQIGRAAKPKVIKKAIEEIAKYPGNSIKYKVYHSLLLVLYGFHTGNYVAVVKDCTKVLDYLTNSKGSYASHFQFFLSKKGIAHIALGQYSAAAHSLKAAHSHAPPHSFNDYTTRLYSIINTLHASDYSLAHTLLQRAKRCPYTELHEQFLIIEAYLYFLARSGHLQLDKPFRLGRYLNETFKAQADKKGDKVNILIAELLVYLVRDRGKFIDRVEAVQAYSYRYLGGAETKRARWFIRILCSLPKANFHPVALARVAQRQIANLEKHPIRLGDNLAVEVVPFGRLLEMIMQQLKTKRA
ncbi:MAG: hypothetical protein AAGG75_04295 [Bacteroidota bacterium]